MLHKRLTILLSCLLFFVCTDLLANSVAVSFTPPAERERDVAPRGYQRCQMMPAGFYNGHWHNRHRICHYPGGVWTSGYWQCLHYKPHSGMCMNWGWVPSHWDRPVAYVPAGPVVRPGPVVIQQPAPVVVQPAPVQPIFQVSLGNNNDHHHHHGHH